MVEEDTTQKVLNESESILKGEIIGVLLPLHKTWGPVRFLINTNDSGIILPGADVSGFHLSCYLVCNKKKKNHLKMQF